MKVDLLRALLNSILKWIDRSMGKEVTEKCDLCIYDGLFVDDKDYEECGLCPIYLETGEEICNGTSYYDWREIVASFGFDDPRAKELAFEMLELLISLLPEEVEYGKTKN